MYTPLIAYRGRLIAGDRSPNERSPHFLRSTEAEQEHLIARGPLASSGLQTLQSTGEYLASGVQATFDGSHRDAFYLPDLTD